MISNEKALSLIKKQLIKQINGIHYFRKKLRKEFPSLFPTDQKIEPKKEIS